MHTPSPVIRKYSLSMKILKKKLADVEDSLRRLSLFKRIPFCKIFRTIYFRQRLKYERHFFSDIHSTPFKKKPPSGNNRALREMHLEKTAFRRNIKGELTISSSRAYREFDLVYRGRVNGKKVCNFSKFHNLYKRRGNMLRPA